MRTVLTMMLTIAAIAPAGAADLSDAVYRAAIRTIADYASEMNYLVPCAYSQPIEGDKGDTVDKTWGPGAVAETLARFTAKTGASPAQIAAIRQAFDDNYHPTFRIDDIRRFGQYCLTLGIFRQIAMLDKMGRPLMLRSPFRASD